MSKRLLTFLLEDIFEAIGRIETYSDGLSRDSFAADRKAVDAVVRNLEIIGEAAGNLPQSYRETHADIEWGQIVGFRNRELPCPRLLQKIIQELPGVVSSFFNGRSLASDIQLGTQRDIHVVFSCDNSRLFFIQAHQSRDPIDLSSWISG